MASTSTLSSYGILGISRSAGCHVIKAAYRKLARVCHPGAVSMKQKEVSANEFMELHAAYSTLSDPDKRANYDRDLYSHERPLGSSSNLRSAVMAAASGQTTSRWETDQCW